MEMVIPQIASTYKEVEIYWPMVDNIYHYGTLDYTRGEIRTRTEQLIALVAFDGSTMFIYNIVGLGELGSRRFAMTDPEIHRKAYNYLERLIKNNLCVES